MHLSTMDHHKKSMPLRRLFALVWMGGCLLPLLGQVTSDPISNPDSIQTSAEWKQHEKAGQDALDKASACLSKALDSKQMCDPSQFLRKAGAEYEKLEVLLAGTQGHLDGAALVANGFLRSGLPARSIAFLISRRETGKDPVLTHLLADSLFAMGDFPNAGKAYRAWIETGCGGYLYSLHGKNYWVRPLKGNPCTYLPEALRTRLELLKQSAGGEPRNLPEESNPAVPWR